jgi:hypothetical protein
MGTSYVPPNVIGTEVFDDQGDTADTTFWDYVNGFIYFKAIPSATYFRASVRMEVATSLTPKILFTSTLRDTEFTTVIPGPTQTTSLVPQAALTTSTGMSYTSLWTFAAGTLSVPFYVTPVLFMTESGSFTYLTYEFMWSNEQIFKVAEADTSIEITDDLLAASEGWHFRPGYSRFELVPDTPLLFFHYLQQRRDAGLNVGESYASVALALLAKLSLIRKNQLAAARRRGELKRAEKKAEEEGEEAYDEGFSDTAEQQWLGSQLDSRTLTFSKSAADDLLGLEPRKRRSRSTELKYKPSTGTTSAGQMVAHLEIEPGDRRRDSVESDAVLVPENTSVSTSPGLAETKSGVTTTSSLTSKLPEAKSATQAQQQDNKTAGDSGAEIPSELASVLQKLNPSQRKAALNELGNVARSEQAARDKVPKLIARYAAMASGAAQSS